MALSLLIHLNTSASTLHVWPDSPSPGPPYADWTNAAHTIQDAVDAATDGDTVLVTNGVYATGGRAVHGNNRVAIDKPLTVQSVNGPEVTLITGSTGAPPTRCAYVGTNAVLSGFTLAGGSARGTADPFGGGALAEPSGVLTNCVLTGNRGDTGGGVFGGTLRDCIVSNNFAGGGGGASVSTLYHCVVISNYVDEAEGGGVRECTLYDCRIESNVSNYRGGGAYDSTLYRCTVSSNSVGNFDSASGGGADQCVIYDSVLVGNSAQSWYEAGGGGAAGCTLVRCKVLNNSAIATHYASAGGVGGTAENCILAGNLVSGRDVSGAGGSGTLRNCTIVGNSTITADGGGFGPGDGTNCIVYGNTLDGVGVDDQPDPRFVNMAAGDYRLRPDSWCIDAGTNLSAIITNDLEGNPRPLDGDGDGVAAFDFGAYEFVAGPPPTIAVQPLSRTNVVGSSLMLSVTAEGSGELSYQWIKDGEELAGAANRTHVLANVQPTDAGAYQVRVFDSDGVALSSNAVVTLVPAVPPSVLAGPITNVANGHIYYLLNQSTWVEAEGAAQTLSGHLVSVGNQAEQDWVLGQFGNWGGQQRLLWIGFYDADPVLNATNPVDRRAEFVWANGEPVSYVNWNAVEPNNYRERGEYYVHTLAPSDPAGPGAWVDAWDVNFNGRSLHGVVEVVPRPPITLYVNAASSSPGPPYDSWETAAHTIQDAVDAAQAGDIVRVTNGTYTTGGKAVIGTLLNRVAIDKAITVQSVNGPGVTLIYGGSRCAYVGADAVLSGFSLINGRAGGCEESPSNGEGGGAWCEASAILTNCVLAGNEAEGAGGGVRGGILYDCTLDSNQAREGGGAYASVLFGCTLTNNVAPDPPEPACGYSQGRGGGAAQSTVDNCLVVNNGAAFGGGTDASTLHNSRLTGNRAVWGGGGANGGALYNCVLSGNWVERYGGGAVSAALTHCTVVGNEAEYYGGGVYSGTVTNCIIYYNSSGYEPSFPDVLAATVVASCFGPPHGVEPEPLTNGNITNAPAFVDREGGNFHLLSSSPCIDAGINLSAIITNDIDGNPRPLDGDGDGTAAFDMGAYEFNPGTPPVILVQPLSRTNVVGSSLMLSVTAEGSGPLSYQWLKDGEALPDATERTHVLVSVESEDSGAYEVRVTDSDGFAVSSNAVVTIIPAVLPSVLAGPITNPGNSHVYYLLNQSTWVEAEGAAQNLGGHLVSVGTQAEQNWVLGQFGNWGGQERLLWTGFHDADPVHNADNPLDRRSEFVWADGEPVSYVNWETGQPNNFGDTGEFYVHMRQPSHTAAGQWNDTRDVAFSVFPFHGVVEVVPRPPITLYVNAASSSPGPPYDSWETAAHTIQDAVDAASEGDTVVVTNGTYATGGRAVNGTVNNRVAIDKVVTVLSVNGPEVTIIDAIIDGSGGRCAYVGTNALLSGFTLTRGFSEDSDEPFGGGALAETSGVLTNCILTGNRSGNGGGVFGGTLRNCIVKNNIAGGGGGASSSRLYNCVVISNSVDEAGGGGVLESILYDCRVEANVAYSFGGGADQSTLYRCSVTGNSAVYPGASGGGVRGSILYECSVTGNMVESPWDGSGGGASGSTLYRCTVSGNSVRGVDYAAGGGISRSTAVECVVSNNSVLASKSWVYGGGAEGSILRNCLVVHNQAMGTSYGDQYPEVAGGGATSCTLSNCTVAANSAMDESGGVFLARGGGVHFSTLQNCIVFNNTAATGSEYSDSAFSYSCTTPLPESGLGNISQPPAFVSPAAGDYHLTSTSPCIDTGIDLSVIITNDIDGNPRPLDGNGDGIAAFDMGAYEFDLRTIVPANWFSSYGLDPNDPHVAAGNPDDDAFTTYQEWVADTDPTNALSFFRIESITASSPVHVYFQSSSNRLYTLRYTTNVVPVVWAEVPGQVDVPGSGGLDALTDTTNGLRRFYRLGVRAP